MIRSEGGQTPLPDDSQLEAPAHLGAPATASTPDLSGIGTSGTTGALGSGASLPSELPGLGIQNVGSAGTETAVPIADDLRNSDVPGAGSGSTGY